MKKSVVLCSGGFDSIVLVNDAVSQGYAVHPLFFNYGQKNLDEELKMARKVCAKFNLNLQSIELPDISWSSSSILEGKEGSTYLEMRNLIFISYAFSYAESIGATSIQCAFMRDEDHKYYTDTSPRFVKSFSRLSKLTGIEFLAPYMYTTKNGLAPLARKYAITKDDFFSCNFPKTIDDHLEPCGVCGDCVYIDKMYSDLVNRHPHSIILDNGFNTTTEFEHSVKDRRIDNAKFFVNNKCQFSCKHCLYGFSEMDREQMSIPKMIEVIDELVSQGVKHIDFGGKEPLYDATVFYLLKHLANNHPNVSATLITNGVNIPKYINSIVKFLPDITLSVEPGVNLSRDGDSHLEKNITMLVDRGVKVSLSVDVFKDNTEYIQDAILNYKLMGVSSFYLKPILPLGCSVDYVKGRMITPSKYWEFATELAHSPLTKRANIFTDFPKEFMRELYISKIPSFDKFLDYYRKTGFNKYGHTYLSFELFCERFNGKVAVTADGYVLGCGQEIAHAKYHELAVGNLHDSTLADLLKIGKNDLTSEKYICNEGCYFSKFCNEKG